MPEASSSGATISTPPAATSKPSSSKKPKIVLSEACVNRIKEANELVDRPDRYLRVIIGPGGCSGFMTEFTFDETKNDNDEVIEQDGARALIDDVSLKYLRGATVDWEDTLAGSQFFIRDNPQAVNGCSCGVSFDVQDEEDEDDELG